MAKRAPIGGLVAGVAALLATATAALAEEKDRYSLFERTPDRLLRDMTTDRPDTTESPFTIDAGRIQVETSLFGYARSRRDAEGAVTETFEFATTNLRIGLTHNAELGVVWQPWGIVRTRGGDPAAATRQSGIGGLDIRGKLNLWGNDDFEEPGATAFGLLPFVTVPTDRGNGIGPDAVEGGLLLPLAIVLPADFGLGLNAGAVRTKAGESSRYHMEYLLSASLAYAWSEALGTYYEVAARLNVDSPDGDAVVLATGLTYKLGDNLQLDMGVNVGVTAGSDRVNPFVGVSRRF
ncbi:MAG: transporter [Rhodospirillales bacterium]